MTFTNLAIALLLIAYSCEASGQSRWRNVGPQNTDLIVYSYTSLSCNGRNCTAAGFRSDYSVRPVENRIVLYRSTDDGITWEVLDSGLPVQSSQNANQIYRIQQIDSMNVVGTGDTGLVIRTFDGGKTWEKQNLPSRAFIRSVHFSDPATGIIVADTLSRNVFTTTDSGRHWSAISLPRRGYDPWDAHSYGGGMYRVMSLFYGGLLFTTRDNWKTYDTSYVRGRRDSNIQIYHCEFGTGDTMLACGVVINGGEHNLFMTRSTNGGLNWTQIEIPDNIVGSPRSSSGLEHNNIFVCGSSQQGPNTIVVSTDRGTTWRIDTILFDSVVRNDTTMPVYFIRFVQVTSSEHAIALLGLRGDYLVRLEPYKAASVESYERIVRGTRFYPNPSNDRISIASVEPFRTLHFYNVLGEQVLNTRLDARGISTLDVTKLPSGVYSAIMDLEGKSLFVGKVAVSGR